MLKVKMKGVKGQKWQNPRGIRVFSPKTTIRVVKDVNKTGQSQETLTLAPILVCCR